MCVCVWQVQDERREQDLSKPGRIPRHARALSMRSRLIAGCVEEGSSCHESRVT